MKLLLNMNMPPSLVSLLENQGHRARHVGQIGLSKAGDTDIVNEARKSEEIIITNDLDYGRILAFESSAKPSVIMCRLANSERDRLFKFIKDALKRASVELETGAIVVIEEQGLRIRSLPLAE